MSFSLQITLQKMLKSAIKAGLGVVIGFIGAENLKNHGVNVDIELLSAGLSVVVIGFLEGLRNLLKNKFKISWL